MVVYNVIGLMSGTSLDGVDLAFCQFSKDDKWKYNILNARTYDYPQKWTDILGNIHELPRKLIDEIHIELGQYYGQLIANFIEEYQLVPDFISSHGHTVFHQPSKNISLQIGSGGMISSITKLPVINDFRKKDVSMGGQGAPLVPIGDHLLFNEYSACLNLGGFANVSYVREGKRLAYDICPVNMALNEISRRTGVEYDQDGLMARSGDVDIALLERLNDLKFYQEKGPKSLGKEWYTHEFQKALNKKRISPIDVLSTLVEHIAQQIADNLNELDGDRVLVTGGGTYNGYLMERLQHLTRALVIIPGKQLIEFKEALIFGFLGVLRMRSETNVLASVTGASKDHCSGVIHKP